jgi:hypothetical protein
MGRGDRGGKESVQGRLLFQEARAGASGVCKELSVQKEQIGM